MDEGFEWGGNGQWSHKKSYDTCLCWCALCVRWLLCTQVWYTHANQIIGMNHIQNPSCTCLLEQWRSCFGRSWDALSCTWTKPAPAPPALCVRWLLCTQVGTLMQPHHWIPHIQNPSCICLLEQWRSCFGRSWGALFCTSLRSSHLRHGATLVGTPTSLMVLVWRFFFLVLLYCPFVFVVECWFGWELGSSRDQEWITPSWLLGLKLVAQLLPFAHMSSPMLVSHFMLYLLCCIAFDASFTKAPFIS